MEGKNKEESDDARQQREGTWCRDAKTVQSIALIIDAALPGACVGEMRGDVGMGGNCAMMWGDGNDGTALHERFTSICVCERDRDLGDREVLGRDRAS